MAKYLEKLYFWFLLGPITLEWLRRKRKLCWATTALVDEESGNEEIVEESRRHYLQLGTNAYIEGELRPLNCATSNTRTDCELTIGDNMRTLRITVQSLKRVFRRIICQLPVGLGYVVLTLVALPVGISSGGLSFFRFDENEEKPQSNFWDVLLPKKSAALISYFALYIGQSFKSLVFSCSVGSLAKEAGLFQQTFQRLSGVIGFHPTCICLFFA